MKSTGLLLFLLVCTLNICAQSVKGRVVDSEENTPLTAANIVILAADSSLYSALTSDADGKFQLDIPFNRFYVNVSYLGYVDYKIEIRKQDKEEIDLGEISLQKDFRELDEFVVSASAVTTGLSKTIAYPTAVQTKASSNGIELLKNLNLPGLFIDPVSQSVQVSGTSKVIYKINGRTVSLQEILAIKPERVLRIEYGDTPTARYANDDAATINVILKKEENGTFLFADFTSALTTGFINGNTSLRSVFGKSELAVNYSVNWRDYDKRWAYEEEIFNLPAETYSLVKDYNKAPFGYTYQNIDVSYTFNGSKDIFSAKLYNTIYSSFQHSDIDIKRVEDERDDISRQIYSKDKSYSPSLDLFYNRKLDDGSGMEFNLVGTYMDSDYFRNLTDNYVNQANEKSLVNNNTDGDKKSLIFEGLYYNTTSVTGYSLGVRGTYSHTKNMYDRLNTSKLKQLETYPYAELNGRIKNFNYSLGTGIKIYSMDNYSNSKDYYRNLSTFSLRYAKSSLWSLRYHFSYTPSYPSLSDLSDVYQRQDTLTALRGNPSVKPSETISNRLFFAFNHKKVNIYTTLYVQKTFDAINDEIYYDEELELVVIQKKNQSYTNAIGSRLEVVIPSIFKMFTVSIGAYWNRYESKGEGYKYSYNDFHWLTMLYWQYKDFTVNAGYKKPEKVMYGRYKNQLENFSIVGMSYKRGNLVLKGGVYFPLTSGTKYVNERISDIAYSKVSRYIKDNANMVYLGITYNISWGKSPFKVNKKLQNRDNDSGILKPQDH